jgi:hypothetical protein
MNSVYHMSKRSKKARGRRSDCLDVNGVNTRQLNCVKEKAQLRRPCSTPSKARHAVPDMLYGVADPKSHVSRGQARPGRGNSDASAPGA